MPRQSQLIDTFLFGHCERCAMHSIAMRSNLILRVLQSAPGFFVNPIVLPEGVFHGKNSCC